MSQNVSCPKCGHAFEVDAEFEKYEKIVAEIVGGELAPKGTAGYDIKGLDGVTYQVKHTKCIYKLVMRGRGYEHWQWKSNRFPKRWADFFVLFTTAGDGYLMFLLDGATARCRTTFSGGNGKIESNTGVRAWIWNYHVTPETFLQKRDELMRNHQLTLEIESQYT